MHYFDTNHCVKIHDEIINLTGGKLGILNEGLIESILIHSRNDQYYPTLEDKVTHLLFSFVKNHCFVDGNKRSAVALSAYMLEINAYENMVSNYMVKLENITIDVALNSISKDLLKKIVTALIYDGEYSEELKIEIINAKNN
ncbi:MAG: type II toxin-antitoxin system death-on-curing family toxin [Bacteroidia bacterium]|nr:type II toxin-antitoxin system death-on-curing family toxin [Bacteroidia bacterium]